MTKTRSSPTKARTNNTVRARAATKATAPAKPRAKAAATPASATKTAKPASPPPAAPTLPALTPGQKAAATKRRLGLDLSAIAHKAQATRKARASA